MISFENTRYTEFEKKPKIDAFGIHSGKVQ